jgi:hypothetical protein
MNGFIQIKKWQVYLKYLISVCLFDWVLRHTDTVKVIWRHVSFTGGGRPKVPYFRYETGT